MTQLGTIVVAATAGEAGADPALVAVLLVVGLAATMGGLHLLLGRRHPTGTTSATATTPATPADDPDAPCDWELRIDLGDDDPVIARAARGRPCCRHTLRLVSDRPLPPSEVDEHLTWSDARTRATTMAVSSPTRHRVASTSARPRGAGLVVSAAVGRGPGPTITTPWVEAAEGEGTRVEQLWAAHLERLRERGARTADDEVPGLQVRATDRSRLVLEVERGCDRGHHRRRVEVRLAATVEVDGHGDAAVSVDRLGASTTGDLTVRATTVASGAAAAHVVGDGLALPDLAPGQTALVVGQGDDEAVDVGLVLQLTSDLAATLTLPEDAEEVDRRLVVAVDHGIRLVVMPEEMAPPGSGDVACACAPAYQLHLGELPPHDASLPDGQLVLGDGDVLVIRRTATGAGPPRWSVTAGGSPEEDDDDGGGAPGPGAVADGRWAGTGQRVDGDPGRADRLP